MPAIGLFGSLELCLPQLDEGEHRLQFGAQFGGSDTGRTLLTRLHLIGIARQGEPQAARFRHPRKEGQKTVECVAANTVVQTAVVDEGER
jgi:hypothetical protein